MIFRWLIMVSALLSILSILLPLRVVSLTTLFECWRNGRTQVWTSGRTKVDGGRQIGREERGREGWVGKWMGEWMDGWMGRWVDGWLMCYRKKIVLIKSDITPDKKQTNNNNKQARQLCSVCLLKCVSPFFSTVPFSKWLKYLLSWSLYSHHLACSP